MRPSPGAQVSWGSFASHKQTIRPGRIRWQLQGGTSLFKTLASLHLPLERWATDIPTFHTASFFFQNKETQTSWWRSCISLLFHKIVCVSLCTVLSDLPQIPFTFCSPINFSLSSESIGRGRYQVCLLENLQFQFNALGSTYPHAFSLLSGPAASDLTIRGRNCLGPTAIFLPVPLWAVSFLFPPSQ